jgi:hypothetical protein
VAFTKSIQKSPCSNLIPILKIPPTSVSQINSAQWDQIAKLLLEGKYLTRKPWKIYQQQIDGGYSEGRIRYWFSKLTKDPNFHPDKKKCGT